MPTLNSRTKGANGERELCHLLGDHLGAEVQRNLEQCRNGGTDVLFLDTWAIQCKRQQTIRLASWWNQACLEADGHGLIPVLAYRPNRHPWRFVLPLERYKWPPLAYTRTLYIEGFVEIVRECQSSIAC